MALPLGKLQRFSTIGLAEKMNLDDAMKRPLSGYLGGVFHASGHWTERLEDEWAEAVSTHHAVACNSATSGLLAACMAAGLGAHSTVWVTPLSMSATAACALRLGATVKFMDIEPVRYGLNPDVFPHGEPPDAIIVANIFGHPARLRELREWCDVHNVVMIEDNAQSPFAMEGARYAGTIGHMGVFSLNVHKHLQCGEGGIVVTNDSVLAHRLRAAVNHGELNNSLIGLNLRMTQPTAAIACAQLKKREEIIASRVDLAHRMSFIFRGLPDIQLPAADQGCTHVYYLWSARLPPDKRDKFTALVRESGFPLRDGYAPLLPAIFHIEAECPVAEQMQRELITFEICAHNPSKRQLIRMREIVSLAAAEAL